MILIRTIITAFAIVFLLGGCATAPKPPGEGIPLGDYSYLREKISWMIEQQLDNGVAGISIALIDGQTTVWEQGFGYANLEEKIPATAETVFEVGSISKVFTATAVMQLVEKDRVDLNQPFSNYLPSFKLKPPLSNAENWNVEQITPHTILTHHSGIPGDFMDFTISKEIKPHQKLVLRLRNEHSTNHPNTVFAYSNNAFSLLGQMIEEISSTPYVEYMHVLFILCTQKQ